MPLCQTFVKADKHLHALKGFDCGKPPMNEYLALFAIKNMVLGLNTTWVLPVDEPAKSDVAAYYTLASATVNREQILSSKRLPRYPVPVALLARLAVDKKFQGQRLGEKTLVTALRHTVQLCDRGLPALGLILDVLDNEALTFYQRFELFQPFTDDPMRLFTPMETLRKI